jgi:hypothetical protein
VAVPDANAGSAAGMALVESPVSTVVVHGTKELAYPALIPGTYTLDPTCQPDYKAADPVILGSVTVPHLGVDFGIYDNAMVVFAARTTGGVTTVTYGAVGDDEFDSLNPPADDACVDGGGPLNTATFWQPVRDLVSQRVNGTQEWLSTGTLVFRDSREQSPRGRFYYNCDQDTRLGPPSGIIVP